MMPQTKAWNFKSSYNMQQAAFIPRRRQKKKVGSFLLSYPKMETFTYGPLETLPRDLFTASGQETVQAGHSAIVASKYYSPPKEHQSRIVGRRRNPPTTYFYHKSASARHRREISDLHGYSGCEGLNHYCSGSSRWSEIFLGAVKD
jgi:hypothetical protein